MKRLFVNIKEANQVTDDSFISEAIVIFGGIASIVKAQLIRSSKTMIIFNFFKLMIFEEDFLLNDVENCLRSTKDFMS